MNSDGKWPFTILRVVIPESIENKSQKSQSKKKKNKRKKKSAEISLRRNDFGIQYKNKREIVNHCRREI